MHINLCCFESNLVLPSVKMAITTIKEHRVFKDFTDKKYKAFLSDFPQHYV
jgi:hypothetical protein